MAKTAWWQKPTVQQTWQFARVASLLMLVPLLVVIGIQKAGQRRVVPQSAIFDRVGFTPDGATVIVAGRDTPDSGYFVTAWNAQTGMKRWRRDTSGPVETLTASPDSKRLLVICWAKGGGHERSVFDSQTGRLYARLHETYTRGTAFWIGDGKILAVPSPRDITLYPQGGGKPRSIALPESPSSWIQNVPGQDLFLITRSVGSGNDWISIVEVRRLPDGKVLRTLARGEPVSVGALSGARAVISDEAHERMTLLDLKTGKRLTTVRLVSNVVGGLRVTDSPAGQGYLDVLSTFESMGYVKGEYETWTMPERQRWNVKTGEMRPLWRNRIKGNVVLAPDGNTFVRWERGKPLLPTLHDARTGDRMRSFEAHTGE